MTSANAAPGSIEYTWHVYVSVPGEGRAFAHGTVTVPVSFCWDRVTREVAAWLRSQGSTVQLADIHLILAPNAGKAV
ncbi:hypothetical protein ACH4S8_22525 [Streptomyces sp. NPDC021080]|uniref:hypothetical protein n=1 Tax=Streptomyces sp. NPDC021080 TaxID=3365110 RepID=UPI00378DC020